MELSALPKDVLELGQLLVSEFLGERDNDTLSRWFLHAIAERLLHAQKARTAPQRKKAEDEASDLILRFWRHRKATSIGADPLSQYDGLFKALQLLLPTANPWSARNTTETQRLAAELFDCLSKLTTALMLLSTQAGQLPTNKRRLLSKFLPTNESAILSHFEYVKGLISENAEERPIKNMSGDRTRSLSVGDYASIVRLWTTQTRKTLASIDNVLATLHPAPQGQSPSTSASGADKLKRNRKRSQSKRSAQPRHGRTE
jgi:hypothetical protein